MASKNAQGGKGDGKLFWRKKVGKVMESYSITSCKCERSESVLKRLNTYLRASMGQNRLSALAHINLNVDIDANCVLKILCKRDRALVFTNIFASTIA